MTVPSSISKLYSKLFIVDVHYINIPLSLYDLSRLTDLYYLDIILALIRRSLPISLELGHLAYL